MDRWRFGLLIILAIAIPCFCVLRMDEYCRAFEPPFVPLICVLRDPSVVVTTQSPWTGGWTASPSTNSSWNSSHTYHHHHHHHHGQKPTYEKPSLASLFHKHKAPPALPPPPPPIKYPHYEPYEDSSSEESKCCCDFVCKPTSVTPTNGTGTRDAPEQDVYLYEKRKKKKRKQKKRPSTTSTPSFQEEDDEREGEEDDFRTSMEIENPEVDPFGFSLLENEANISEMDFGIGTRTGRQTQLRTVYQCRTCGTSCSASTNKRSRCNCAVVGSNTNNSTCTCTASCANEWRMDTEDWSDESGEWTSCIFTVQGLNDTLSATTSRPYNCECSKSKAAEWNDNPDFVCVCQRVGWW